MMSIGPEKRGRTKKDIKKDTGFHLFLCQGIKRTGAAPKSRPGKSANLLKLEVQAELDVTNFVITLGAVADPCVHTATKGA